jgi:ribosomal protein S28E/S33
VSFRENVRFEAPLDVKGSSSFTLTGLGGITIEVNALTQYKNTSFAALSSGNYLRIRGRPGSGNNVVATEVELQGGGNTSRVIMQAVASNVTRPNVTLLGITINTSAMGTFKDINDNVITADQFFAVAAAGKLVKARGGLSGGTITWNQEIQLED